MPMRACKQLAPIQLDPGHYSHELQDDDGFGVSALETEKPSKEAAREFLTGKLPSTIRVNVDHDPQR